MKNLNKKFKITLGTLAVAAVIYGAGVTSTVKAQEDALSAAQTEAVQNIIKSYLVENPQVVVDALDAYQQNKEVLERQAFEDKFEQYKDTIFDTSLSPTAGNPDGDVKVVEFFDYNCGYCKKALSDVVALIDEDPGVQVIFKEMPILSPQSHEAARWALASDKQGKYFDFHIALMNTAGTKDEAALVKIAEELKLDVDKLRADVKSPEIQAQIDANMALARDLGIRGTPGFIIGDRLSPGYMGIDAMKQVVKDVRDAQ